MQILKSLLGLALAAGLLPAPARAAPVLEYGFAAFITIDAGAAHWHTNVVESGTVLTSGVISQGVNDNAGGGAQAALTSAYASVGSLGGKVLAVASGNPLHAGQGFDDLSWYVDFLVTGTPGTKVSYLLGASLDGVTAGAGQGYSGAVQATTLVGGTLLADWTFNVLTNPGPFDQLAVALYEFDVGTVVRFNSRMTVGARADREATVEADAFTTSAFYVDVLTPGGGYLAGGGVVFPNLPAPAGVPEPPSVALLGAALLLAGLTRARRRGG